MEKGDLEVGIQGRFLFVFENLIGIHPNAWDRAQEKVYLKTRQWKAAVNTWELSGQMIAQVWDIAWRHHVTVDLVTFRPPGFATALLMRLETENIPVRSVAYFSSADHLSRRLAHMPDVMTVFYADPQYEFKFGSRGRMIRHGGIGFSPWV